MLRKIRLTDFKSFVDEEVALAPLTLLVGANASGKSNFLDAIRFLHGLSRNLTLSEVLNGEENTGSDRWPGVRGRAEEAARVGAESFSIESTWLGGHADRPSQPEIRHRLLCRPRLGEIVCEKPNGVFSEIRFLEIQPGRMRDYGRRSAPLGNEGKNFSGALATLCRDPETRQSLVSWLREVCAPELEDIDFAEVKELGDVMAIFVEKGGTRISARSISDGTLRFLGTLLALRTAEPGEVILIEEIEEGLHPTRIHLLVEFLESVVREREIQVIATTHSPVVLQWLSPQALRDVIVFGRVPDREGTLMQRLGDLPHVDEVVQRKGIEELFTTGWLEMAL
jgi:predicted ATPase